MQYDRCKFHRRITSDDGTPCVYIRVYDDWIIMRLFTRTISRAPRRSVSHIAAGLCVPPQGVPPHTIYIYALYIYISIYANRRAATLGGLGGGVAALSVPSSIRAVYIVVSREPKDARPVQSFNLANLYIYKSAIASAPRILYRVSVCARTTNYMVLNLYILGLIIIYILRRYYMSLIGT